MTQSAETHPDANLTDPSPKRKPGRPKGSKDKKPRKNARRVAQRAPRARSSPAQPRPGSNQAIQVNARWPRDALALIDAYTEAQEHDTRSEAVREAALSWVERWDRLRRQEARQQPAPMPLRARIRLAWSVLLGKYSAAQTGAGVVLREASNTD